MEESYPCVVKTPDLFKMKLGIGEEAYQYLRLQKNLLAFLEAGSFGLTGSTIASSAVVAQTFFSGSGFWAFLGIGTAATPIGWAIAAGVLSGIAYFGLSNIYKKGKDGKVIIVPKFINTPLDLLAVGLSDMILPLALELANADGEVTEPERENIIDYLVSDWGYDRQFIIDRLKNIETLPSKKSLKLLATSFAQFLKNNPDCNHTHISQEIIEFLDDLSRADRIYSPQEKEYIELVKGYFSGVFKPTWKDIARFWILKFRVSSKILARAFKRRFFSTKKTPGIRRQTSAPAAFEPDNVVLDQIIKEDLKARMRKESLRRRQMAFDLRQREFEDRESQEETPARPDSNSFHFNIEDEEGEVGAEYLNPKPKTTYEKRSWTESVRGFFDKVISIILTLISWTIAIAILFGSMYLIYRLRLLPAVIFSLVCLWIGRKIQKSVKSPDSTSPPKWNPILISATISTTISVLIYTLFMAAMYFD